MPTTKLTIVVSGTIATVPGQGGWAWAVLQYLLGFRRLGHEVYFVESIGQEALCPEGASLESSANAEYLRGVMRDFGLDQCAALILAGTRQTVGLSYPQMKEAAGRASVLVNISGTFPLGELTDLIPCRLYLDVDPAFTQLWQASQGIDMRLAGHTHFATVGPNLGQADCGVPSCGLSWIGTLPPVVLSEWPAWGPSERQAITTVANWRGYGSIEHGGVFYGQKAHSLRRFINLPTLTREKFQLALAIHPGEVGDRAALAANGWEILDPAQVAATPADYQRFIQGSKAEFGIAKSGYVASRCGWFSDRSVCYLASGRPVMAQETGFSRFLPTGEGLFAFETTEDILAAIDALNQDYPRQARAARAIAEEYFDSDKVLGRLLQKIGVGP